MEENRYLLTMIIAKRAKQLFAGAKPLIRSKHKNPVAIALEEVKEGKVLLKEHSNLKKDNPLERIFKPESC